MSKKIKSHAYGKLRIYIAPAEKMNVPGRSTWQKLFPKSAYIHIVQDAKAEGIMNASVYNSQLGYSHSGKIMAMNVEANNAKLTLCVELVDKREKLESFFLKHNDYLKGKVVIYKEVEYWDAE